MTCSLWLRTLAALLISTGVAFASGCRQRQDMPAPQDPSVVVVVPIKRQIVEWDEYTGRLEAVEAVDVRARVSGYLQSIHFEEGQIVDQGQLLCVIDPRPFAAAAAQAKAALAEAQARIAVGNSQLAQAEAEQKKAAARLTLAKNRFARDETLVARTAISQDEFEETQTQLTQAEADIDATKAAAEAARATIATSTAGVETAKAALAAAQLELTYTRVVAAVAGRVGRCEVTEGNLIGGGTRESTLLTTIVSLDPIHCYFDADEQAYLKYSRLAQEGKRQSSRNVKNPVYIALADEGPGFPHLGHMNFVDNRMDTGTGTMRARAIFRNGDLLLTPGLFARLRLPGSGRYEAVLLPDSAVGNDQAEKFVLVVDEEEKAQRKVVQVGPVAHGLRIVRSGLTGDERVIVRGLQRVRVGSRVAATIEPLEVTDEEGLPDDYVPVPEEQWITIGRAQRAPPGDPAEMLEATLREGSTDESENVAPRVGDESPPEAKEAVREAAPPVEEKSSAAP